MTGEKKRTLRNLMTEFAEGSVDGERNILMSASKQNRRAGDCCHQAARDDRYRRPHHQWTEIAAEW
jgi:hypothetical protein